MPHKTDERLLAVVVALTVAAAGGTSFLAGCGSGSRTVTVSGPSGGSFAGRSYTASNVSLGGYGTGSLLVAVDSHGGIAATITFADPATGATLGTANLTGTLDSQTGAFSLSGTYTPGRGQATLVPVTVTGTLPTPPATTGGSATITVGSIVQTAAFSASSSPSPSPSPSPSSSPGTTLGSYVTAFQPTMSDTFTYRFNLAMTLNPDPNHQSATATNTFTFHGGSLFNTGAVGVKDTVTIHLPKSGDKVVTRQQQLSMTDGSVTGYFYFTDTPTAHTEYGHDSLSQGKLLTSTRYDDGRITPYSLSVGQTYTHTFTVYKTTYSPTDGTTVTKSFNYDETDTLTFVGIETVTVTAGTYTNCAHYRDEQQYTDPIADTGTTAQPNDQTGNGWVSPYVGTVKLSEHRVVQNIQGTNSTTGQSFLYTETDDDSEELLSANVNGVSYPPGRAAVRQTPR